MEKNKKSKIIDIALTTVGIVLLCFTLILVLTKFIGKDNFIFGSRLDVVLTGSMSEVYAGYQDEYKEKGWTNQIQVHDLIVTSKLSDDMALKPGDIVTYKNPVYGLVTHRIIDAKADIYGTTIRYTIRGDANKDIDGIFVRSDILGKVTNNAGQIGQVVYFFQSIYGVILLVGLAIICFLYSYLRDKIDKKETITANNDVIDLPVNEKDKKDKDKK